jgi:energy-coupling factor transporter ATP-binding protein EcfA2
VSTKNYGCFFCSGKSADAKGNCPNCGAAIDVSTGLLSGTIGEYQPKEVLGRGFYGWTLKVEDRLQNFAMKVVPQHRLAGRVAEAEARNLVACCPHPYIASFIRYVESTVVVNGRIVEVSCMIFEFISDARPLRQIIEEEVPLSRSDVVCILAGIAHGLSRMHSRKLWHYDLHDDNVLVRNVAPDEGLDHRFQPKLIDFGSCRPKDPEVPEGGARGDYFYLSKHIYALVSRFERSQLGALAPADRTFAAKLKQLAHCVADANVSRRDLDPTRIAASIHAALTECSAGHQLPTFEEMSATMPVSLRDPLDKTNALNLEAQDIALLFTDTLGWQAQIKKSETVIVVGPRGCGKTMFLRYLSIASQARPRKGEQSADDVRRRIEKSDYVGFLVSCAELRTPFLRSWYKKLEEKDRARAEDFCREFISTHFALEVARVIVWLKREKLTNIRDEELEAVVATIGSLSGVTPQHRNIENSVEELERRSIQLSNPQKAEAYEPSGLCGDDALLLISRSLKTVPFFAGKEPWFLLDDYSVTVFNTFVQKAYNPVIFRMSSEGRIKLSSEGDGPILSDTLGRQYKEGRELTKLNLGELYFQASEQDGRAFFESILQARFQATGTGSVETLKKLLGEHEHTGSFGRYISSQSRPGDSRFHGFALLCSLCSGDVSFIIELFRKLVGTEWSADRTIDNTTQDRITKQFAQQQLADLRATADTGPKLYEFAHHLGSVLKDYLLNSKDADHVDERLRIVVEGSGDLSQPAQEMHDALLRHSVLINGGSCKGRRGQPARQLFFRRLFAPCFPFSPRRSGSIELSFQQYERFLLEPKSVKAKDEKPDPWESGLGRMEKAE